MFAFLASMYLALYSFITSKQLLPTCNFRQIFSVNDDRKSMLLSFIYYVQLSFTFTFSFGGSGGGGSDIYGTHSKHQPSYYVQSFPGHGFLISQIGHLRQSRHIPSSAGSGGLIPQILHLMHSLQMIPSWSGKFIIHRMQSFLGGGGKGSSITSTIGFAFLTIGSILTDIPGPPYGYVFVGIGFGGGALIGTAILG